MAEPGAAEQETSLDVDAGEITEQILQQVSAEAGEEVPEAAAEATDDAAKTTDNTGVPADTRPDVAEATEGGESTTRGDDAAETTDSVPSTDQTPTNADDNPKTTQDSSEAALDTQPAAADTDGAAGIDPGTGIVEPNVDGTAEAATNHNEDPYIDSKQEQDGAEGAAAEPAPKGDTTPVATGGEAEKATSVDAAEPQGAAEQKAEAHEETALEIQPAEVTEKSEIIEDSHEQSLASRSEAAQATEPGSEMSQERSAAPTTASANAEAVVEQGAPGPAPNASIPDTKAASDAPGARTADATPAADVEKSAAGEGVDATATLNTDFSSQERKKYLGGYRHKKTEQIFHHATTQTPQKPKERNMQQKLEREVQTVFVANRSVQSQREAGTQMERPGVILDNSDDREMVAGEYMTAAELEALRIEKTIMIQRCVRGWFARRRARKLRELKKDRDQFLREQEEKEREEAERHRQREIQRRMEPRRAEDFETLYNELEAWRCQETKKIKESGASAEQQHSALEVLLSKETKLLQTIDRLKTTASAENKAARIRHVLKEMAKPKKWDLSNGKQLQVHTPHTMRAAELSQLYRGLTMAMLSIEERLDVLLHVKWTVKEFDCNLTRDLVELIDREADMLNRGRSPNVLNGLRKRISGLFLAFIETPEFNPEAGTFQISASDRDSFIYQKVQDATSTSVGHK